jgi:hypothetical protein
MAEENMVHIVDFPKEGNVRLEHYFTEKPIQISMLHNQGQTLPLCIKICDPICAESNYKIGINLLGQPFVEIVVKGVTRLFSCKDSNGNPPGNPPTTASSSTFEPKLH